MKQLLFATLFFWTSMSVFAQPSLCLSTDKTTNLIFPFAIKHVDRGAPSVLAQQVKAVPNVLLVKAGAKNFTETNLSVITEDGSVYSFTVCFDQNPAVWVYHLPVQSKRSVGDDAQSLLDNPKIIRGPRNKKWGVNLEMQGIYVKDNVIFFHLMLENETTINYTIDLLRFYIADKHKARRSAVQEVDCKPLTVAGNIAEVTAQSRSSIVVAVDKFTIPDAKYLGVQLIEKNGGRHLSLRLSNRTLIKARPIE